MSMLFNSTITHEDHIGRTIIMFQNKTIDQHSIVRIVEESGSQIIVKSALQKKKDMQQLRVIKPLCKGLP